MGTQVTQFGFLRLGGFWSRRRSIEDLSIGAVVEFLGVGFLESGGDRLFRTFPEEDNWGLGAIIREIVRSFCSGVCDIPTGDGLHANLILGGLAMGVSRKALVQVCRVRSSFGSER